MCYCDWDPPEFYRTAFRVAKKAHECYECGRFVQPGERYRYTTSKQEGSLYECKTCIGCSAGIDWLADNCGCWEHGEIRQGLIDHFDGEQASFKLGRLIVSMGRRAWRRGNGSLLPVPA